MIGYQGRVVDRVAELLQQREICAFLGFVPGWDPLRPVPGTVARPDEARRLVLNGFCGPNLSRYLMEQIRRAPDGGRVGILTRGCEALGVLRLVTDRRVPRERAYLLGVACSGVLDPAKVLACLGVSRRTQTQDPGLTVERGGDTVRVRVTRAGAGEEREVPAAAVLLPKCVECQHPTPVVSDELIGSTDYVGAKNHDIVSAIAALPSGGRYDAWRAEFERCIRCLACRNVCPACSCIACVLDGSQPFGQPTWLERGTEASEQFMFHFIRAFHVAGRCVGCGECERVCPVGIPLGSLNKKVSADVAELFNVSDPYVPSEAEPLGQFSPDDPEGWRCAPGGGGGGAS